MAEKARSINPEWGSSEKIEQACDQMQKIEAARAQDRALVDNLANGGRPWTPDEVKKYHIQINVNWLELSRKLMDATGQINGAFIPPGNFFSCHSEKGNITKRDKYSQDFTKEINAALKEGTSGKRHHFLLRSRNACVALHGIGPFMWSNRTRLLPRFVPLEDLLIPTDTLLDFSVNLSHFAVNLYLTPGELYRMAMTGKPDKGWQTKTVTAVLKDLKDSNNQPFFNTEANDWVDRPEAIQELYKQNRGWLESDAVSKCKARLFFYQDPEMKDGKQQWYRKMILRDRTPSVSRDSFLYDSDTPFADDIDHIIQCQFGDNSLVSPLKYHSVRGLGTNLYGPAFTLNRLRCQAVQHIFQNLLTLWRITDPNDKARLKAILLMQHGIMPDGASIVPNTERHQIDAPLLEFGFAQMKQNLGEQSSSYTSQTDTGTRKERTAFEVKAQLQMSQEMVGNVLSMMYAQEIFYYTELVRRALLKNTDDPTAMAFQRRCKAKRIPDELMVLENWRIVPERVLGAGNPSLAQVEADGLMSQRQAFEPASQQKILRIWTSTLLSDPARAAELVPEEQDKSTSGTRNAEDVYGTLMRGIAVPMRKGIDHVGYVGALLSMMEVEITNALQQGEDAMGTPEQLKGFVTVAQAIEQTLAFLEQDDKNKEIVRQFKDKLNELLNLVKSMAQRQAQAQGAAQPDPEAMAKAQTMTMLAQVKAQIAQMNAAQKAQHRQQQFDQKQAEQKRKHEQDLMIKGAQTAADLQAKGAQTGADLLAKRSQTHADLVAKGAQTGASVQATKMQAEAKANGSEKKDSE